MVWSGRRKREPPDRDLGPSGGTSTGAHLLAGLPTARLVAASLVRAAQWLHFRGSKQSAVFMYHGLPAAKPMSMRRQLPLRDGRSCNVIIIEATADSQLRQLSHGTSSLTFITAAEERLLAPAPEGWAEFTREELASLWEQAVVVRRT